MPKEYRFDYTGGVQSIHLPPGKYKIEAYGAQGGSTYGTGGLGGYSYGELVLDKLTTIFICVGQCPSDLIGGYNGGGNGSTEGAWASVYCSAGGGATHVALVNRGELFNYQFNLSDILLVAGAGGGGAQYSIPFPGSNGGGLQAGKTYHNYWGNYSYTEDTQCIPANQIDSGTPRSGISVFSGKFGRGNLLGGGGLFGGSQFGSSNEVFSGQGGSGYLNTAILNNYGSECGKNSGNGYVVITVVSVIVNPEDFDRLNSNIYKNIFPEEVIDLEYIEQLKSKTRHFISEVIQEDHGLSVNDVVSIRNNKYVPAIANDIYKFEAIQGIVSSVRNKDIFTLVSRGRLPYQNVSFNDTTVLYLSDKNPGKVCHYKEIDNMTYIPIAIYTDGSIIINIMDGTTGAPLAPYDKNQEETQKFESYTQADLDDIIGILWGGPHED